ncbi:MAG: glycoside hydrolase family 5 protein [Fibrobacter sp.]|nr:glycoside hydrolase family 5 protein [Fibrobacter sp.]
MGIIKNIMVSLIIVFFMKSATIEGALPYIKCKDTHFVVASTGEPVVLKGAEINNNVWGFWEWPLSDTLKASNTYPLIPPKELLTWFLDSSDYKRLAELQGNVVRYEIAYEAFAENNEYRDENLKKLRVQMQTLESIGIYTIVCLTLHPGWHVPMDNECERAKIGSQRIPSVFESDSIFSLWETMWTYVAKGLKDLDCCAGFELLNEPRLPATADCNYEMMIADYVAIYKSIRAVNDRHIIFIPEFNSREANPGETYSIAENGISKNVTDTGEQGIIWDRILPVIPDSLINVSYVFHLYEPYEFTHTAQLTFNKSQLTSLIEKKVASIYSKKRPAIVTEYGVNVRQELNGNSDNRILWFRTVHDLFDKHQLSSTVFSYKHLINPWANPYDLFSMYYHFYQYDQYLRVRNDSLQFKDAQAKTAAEASGLDTILYKYFYDKNSFVPVSSTYNDNMIQELRRYCSNGKAPIIRNKVELKHGYSTPSKKKSQKKINIQGRRLQRSPHSKNDHSLNSTALPMLIFQNSDGKWSKELIISK